MLDDGRYASISEMVAAEKLDRGYLGRLLQLTLLAPDIVEAIVEGRQAEGMTLTRLLRDRLRMPGEPLGERVLAPPRFRIPRLRAFRGDRTGRSSDQRVCLKSILKRALRPFRFSKGTRREGKKPPFGLPGPSINLWGVFPTLTAKSCGQAFKVQLNAVK
jgi:hypothetical protein